MRKLAQHFPGLSEAKVGAIIAELQLRDSDEYYSDFSIDSQHYKRYSVKALERIRQELSDLDVEDIWERHKPRRRPR